MNSRKKTINWLGSILYTIGVLLGVILFASAAVADLEAVFYGFQKYSDKSLDNLHCPQWVATSETATISATFKNPTDKPINLMVRADFSSSTLQRQERTTLALAPGETKPLEWTISKDNVDLRFFIFARVATFPAGTLPFRESKCGMVALNLGNFTGGQVFNLAFGISLVGMLLGLGLREISIPPSRERVVDTTRAMRFLAVVVSLGMFVSFRGWWLPGMIILAITVLTFSAIGFYVVTSR